MREAMLVVAVWSVVWNVLFLADFLAGSRQQPNGLTGVDVVGSSIGSLLVILAVAYDAAFNAPSSWLPHLAVLTFAALGYPAWWLRMRQLVKQRTGRSL